MPGLIMYQWKYAQNCFLYFASDFANEITSSTNV
jgi:hypothetical protein